MLKEFGCRIKVGDGIEEDTDEKGRLLEGPPYDIFLLSDGSFYLDPFEMSFTDIKKINLQDFLPPEKILSNLVNVLAETRSANEEKRRQIIMAKRIVQAMSETLIKKPSATE